MSSTLSVDSKSGDPTAYQDAADSYRTRSFASPNIFATSQLQIQAVGYDTNQALTGTTLENISVYRVDSGELEYISLRLKRNSSSCALVSGSDSNRIPLMATIYRWGPGRPPKIRILPPHTSVSVEEAINSDYIEYESVEIRSRSMISRAQRMNTPFGTFEWRYGSSAERNVAYNAASLLIMERTDAVSSKDGDQGKRGVQVAQLVRNDDFRTPGTSRYMGGNGGRLMIDLSMWTDKDKPSAKEVEAFVVASCICMLKREADRFRNNQISAVV
jgi:hypothetical protein